MAPPAESSGACLPKRQPGPAWDAARIRELFASQGLVLQERDEARTDWVTLRRHSDAGVR